ncbi:MAG: FHA domain-containing protein [Planctomycetes bacterium]|nr:FHA domain-containing protein [Planctomycetota bacterium]MBL7044708.1 FHA domain-containing protein [Pirellulaceae bacterium]
MKIKLKVLKGAGAGKEVKIPTPKCLIGRGEDCHMRPKSEAVSRRHCAIIAKRGKVFIRDLESKNGTIVNGKPIEGDYVLKNGDKVQVGPLAFEMLIDHSLGGEKKPKVKSIKEAAVRTTASNQETTQIEDSDISGWLEEGDDLERERRFSGDPDTRQMMLDETDQGTLQKELERRAKEAKLKREQEGEDTKEMPGPKQLLAKKGGSKKKKPGKLPQAADPETQDSGEAAAHVLRKFFNNR